jgi:hypothetical protein
MPRKRSLPPPGNVPPGPSTRTRLTNTASARRASYNTSASYATSSVGSACTSTRYGSQVQVQCLKDLEEPAPTAEGRAEAGAGDVAIGLVARPLPGDVSAAPALVSLLHARECVPRAVAAVFALWDRQEIVSAGWAHILPEEGQLGCLDVTAFVVPSRG